MLQKAEEDLLSQRERRELVKSTFQVEQNPVGPSLQWSRCQGGLQGCHFLATKPLLLKPESTKKVPKGFGAQKPPLESGAYTGSSQARFSADPKWKHLAKPLCPAGARLGFPGLCPAGKTPPCPSLCAHCSKVPASGPAPFPSQRYMCRGRHGNCRRSVTMKPSC